MEHYLDQILKLEERLSIVRQYIFLFESEEIKALKAKIEKEQKEREEAERKIDQVREQYTIQYYLNTIKESDLKPVQVYKLVDNETGEGQSLVIEHKLDKDGKVVKETKEEAYRRLGF